MQNSEIQNKETYCCEKKNNKQILSWKFVMKNHIHVPVGGENEPISGAENLLSGWGDILMFWLDSYKNKQ